MKIEVMKTDLCVECFYANNKAIDKALYMMDALDSKIVIPEETEHHYYEIKGNCIDSIIASIRANESLIGQMATDIEEKDIEIEMLNEEIERLNDTLNSFITDDKYITKRNTIKYEQTKERFMQVHREYLETGVKPYILCKKYHMCPSTYYKYLKMFNKGEL